MFGKKRSEAPIRIEFKVEAEADGSLFQPGEIEEVTATRARELVAAGFAQVTTEPICRLADARSQGDPSWRRQELRQWQEKWTSLQQPSEK